MSIDEINKNRDMPTEVRQFKYLNNVIVQRRRAMKQITKPMREFKSFRTVSNVFVGIEMTHMIRARQMLVPKGKTL